MTDSSINNTLFHSWTQLSPGLYLNGHVTVKDDGRVVISADASPFAVLSFIANAIDSRMCSEMSAAHNTSDNDTQPPVCLDPSDVLPPAEKSALQALNELAQRYGAPPPTIHTECVSSAGTHQPEFEAHFDTPVEALTPLRGFGTSKNRAKQHLAEQAMQDLGIFIILTNYFRGTLPGTH